MTLRPSGTISPLSSASGMNSAGDTQAALGVLPADQRLDAVDRAVVDRHDRLVVQPQLAAFDGAAQRGLGPDPLPHPRRIASSNSS